MLVALLLPDDEKTDGFDELVIKYERKIFNLVYRLIGNYDEAADLTQETFVSAFKSFHSFRGESSVYTWLYRIALNNCKNRFKERERKPEVDALGDGLDDLPDRAVFACYDFNPQGYAERKELKHIVEEAISRLPNDYRIVAVLRDLQGLSYQDISEATGLSVDVVKTRLARARGMLRQKLEPYLREDSV